MKNYNLLRNLPAAGRLVERRDGTLELFVPYRDVSDSVRNRHGDIDVITGDLNREGLHPEQRFLDIVRLWDLTDSTNPFLHYSTEDRDLIWEGNLIPRLTRIEYTILAALTADLKDHYIINSGTGTYLVSQKEVDILAAMEGDEYAYSLTDVQGYDDEPETIVFKDEDDFDIVNTRNENDLELDEPAITPAYVELPFYDLFKGLVREGISTFTVQDLLDYNHVYFNDFHDYINKEVAAETE